MLVDVVRNEEISVEPTEVADRFVGGDGGPEIQAEEDDAEHHTHPQAARAWDRHQVPPLPLDMAKRAADEYGHVHRDRQVVDLLPVGEGLIERAASGGVVPGPELSAALPPQDVPQASPVENSPGKNLYDAPHGVGHSEREQDAIGDEYHQREVAGAEQIHMEQKLSLFVTREEARLRVVEHPDLGLVDRDCAPVRSLNVRFLHKHEESNLQEVRGDADEEHCVRAGDERVAVIQRVAHGVHRVGEQFEDAVEGELEVFAEEEIAPVPAVLANAAMGVHFGPVVESAQTQAHEILGADQEGPTLGLMRARDPQQDVTRHIRHEDQVHQILVQQPRLKRLGVGVDVQRFISETALCKPLQKP
mmetsp:Transcript_22942/g.25465  ORF Transcript_22942/g.25465 Transcript_22942/m.25465 type:complete len:361 (-) Transcript_22942:393-1475(-)